MPFLSANRWPLTADTWTIQPSIQASVQSSTQSFSDYFFSPNGKGLSGVLGAFFLPAFSLASRVRVSTAS